MVDKLFSIQLNIPSGISKSYILRIADEDNDKFSAIVDNGSPTHIRLLRMDREGKYDRLIIDFEGTIKSIILGKKSSLEQTFSVDIDGYHLDISAMHGIRPTPTSTKHDFNKNEIFAPFHSIVSEVLVNQGDILEADQPVLRLESMKVISTYFAPSYCRVTEIFAVEGQAVETGFLLVRFEPLSVTS
ncbi:acetyl-CoA carboxylase biotin carboxyl carrier protein subunit [Xenorhabdus sp. PB61.4]|uniref:acetyl-CoA carboxylase biotin carboxyl carrier protein subunit n=1 Tax=Xenorhabdus TaxID=626 RepID=UPI001E38BC2D|nr:acetyl-CoA carboxylase biotin carboxyl carrier protein subunit [Xenorhabdus sp. PB61.4]MCC8368087.1 acetyl-CoA carboxylase biotin carboxyl carrier protein subunit [Xenorhabdus sp. PB61.4]